jgi:outer membrane protein assembly factor BamD
MPFTGRFAIARSASWIMDSISQSIMGLRRGSILAATLLSAALLLGGCSAGGLLKDMLGGGDSSSSSSYAKGSALAPDLGQADEKAVGKLYNEGLSNLQSGSYKKAQKNFAEVERQHPYSKWATKAILMQAFAAYQSNSYGDAVNATERFIQLHPGHKDTPYAYYLKALSSYEQISEVRRDQSRTQKAVEALDEVAERFPDSPYAADARKKALVARDQLAAKEMEVGRFYMQKGSYLAGINRFKKVVTDYQTSSQTPEALYRLTEGYMALGVVSEAQTAAAVLGHNYPNSDWYKDAYALVSSNGTAPVANRESWIAKAFKKVTG